MIAGSYLDPVTINNRKKKRRKCLYHQYDVKLLGGKLHAANLIQFEDSRSFTLNRTENFQLSVSSPIFNVPRMFRYFLRLWNEKCLSIKSASAALVYRLSVKKKKISPVQQLPSSVLLIFSLVVSQ